MDFNPLVVLATFAVIFPAELPDKSMFAAVVMGTRWRPLIVWIGLASAFLIHVLIAVTAGQLISLLPHRIVTGTTTLLFLAGAIYMFTSKKEESLEASESAEANPGPLSNWRVMATAFGVIFLSEWGDLTQLATINLAARYENPLSVGIGSLMALWLVTGLGVALGNKLVKAVPLALMRRIAGLSLLILAVWSLTDFLDV